MTLWQFIAQNWMLVALACLIVIVLIYLESRLSTTHKTALSAQDSTLKMKEKGTLIIDLRSADRYAEGHIAGAKNFTDTPDAFTIKFKKYQQSIVILTCESGTTANQWIGKLKKQGFEQIYTLAGGIQAWRKEHFPLVKPSTASTTKRKTKKREPS